MRAEIIAVGNELLTASRLDTNSLQVTQELNAIGVQVARKCVVGDRASEIQDVLHSALKRAEVVVLMGGLGPTNDDVTREVVSKALGRRLVLKPEILEDLSRRYARFELRMTSNNRRQALVPEGATVMENPQGTAPGLFLKEKASLVFLLPGPPRELKPMINHHMIPLIRKYKPTSRQYLRMLKVASVGESSLDSSIESIYQAYPKIETTILSSPGIIDLFFHWIGETDEERANQELEEMVGRIREKLGCSIFTDQEEGLETVVGRRLRGKGWTMATAESCTGGLISKMLTDGPGSSEYYCGGVICYNDRLKAELVGVNERTLKRFGAVSESVAREMASGIRKLACCQVGLSVTGIAGPNGATTEKPIGLVFIGLSTQEKTLVKKRKFPGERDVIRLHSARFALDWTRRKLI